MLPGTRTALISGTAPVRVVWNASDKAATVSLLDDRTMQAGTPIGAVRSNKSIDSSLGTRKRYAEARFVTSAGAGCFGIAKSTASLTATVGDNANGYGYFSTGAYLFAGAVSTPTGIASYTNGNQVMVALDLDHLKVWFGKGGLWLSGEDPGLNTGGHTITSGQAWFLMASANQNGEFVLCPSTDTFLYSMPSGFVAWGR